MIALASDHAGFNYKENTKELLDSLGLAWKDYGTDSTDRVDYPDFAHKASKAILEGECDRGIFICGTGIGISIAANRHKGIRAAACQIEEAAYYTRLHNDSNVLAIGERLVSWEAAERIIKMWLDTDFEGGRHIIRVEKIDLP
ncbi:MAG: ribose 5-phosphate isomerase B [Ectothiorhodospiraceae bacterium]|nr:ribose 5-phosphate isomerase B [Ectothiorhodospiraceae bacterium]